MKFQWLENDDFLEKLTGKTYASKVASLKLRRMAFQRLEKHPWSAMRLACV